MICAPQLADADVPRCRTQRRQCALLSGPAPITDRERSRLPQGARAPITSYGGLGLAQRRSAALCADPAPMGPADLFMTVATQQA
jgi:hypothetical protein